MAQLRDHCANWKECVLGHWRVQGNISGEEKLVCKFNLISRIYRINLLLLSLIIIIITIKLFRCSLLSNLKEELNEQGQPE